MKLIRNALILLSSTTILLIAAITLTDILIRALSGQAAIAAYELTSTLMPFVVFLALPIITLEKSHISINLIDSVVPKDYAWILDAISSILGMIVLWIIAGAAWKLGVRALDWNTTTTILQIPLGYVILFISVSLKLTSVIYGIQLIQLMIQNLKKDTV